jgi:hypothetical protein
MSIGLFAISICLLCGASLTSMFVTLIICILLAIAIDILGGGNCLVSIINAFKKGPEVIHDVVIESEGEQEKWKQENKNLKVYSTTIIRRTGQDDQR